MPENRFFRTQEEIEQLKTPKDSKQALIDAVTTGNIKETTRLLDEPNLQLSANLRDKNNDTLLIIAVKNNNPEMVNALLEYGANLNEKDGNQRSASDHANTNGNQEIITALEQRQVDLEEMRYSSSGRFYGGFH